MTDLIGQSLGRYHILEQLSVRADLTCVALRPKGVSKCLIAP